MTNMLSLEDVQNNIQYSLVEKELLRKQIYEEVLKWLHSFLPKLGYKAVCHLLLRYIFNKNISRQEGDDPIFITSHSTIAVKQLQEDLYYSKIEKEGKTTFGNRLISILEEKLEKAALTMKESKVPIDSLIELKNGNIIYKNKIYKDISQLAEKHRPYINYALALNIRYTYLCLWTQGLARQFDKMGYFIKDATEGFASAFNHYFDNFCSAFIDLEKVFGSRGSFFEQKKWDTYVVFVNPPFDVCLMNRAIDKVYEYLISANSAKKFIFTLPNWPNWPYLDDLKVSKWTTECTIYPKGKLGFTDHMNNNKIIYPCDIAEIVLHTTIRL